MHKNLEGLKHKKGKDDLNREIHWLVLKDKETNGVYVSPEFEATPFEEIIGSWGALTTTTNSVELMVRLYVDGTWSTYFSYQPWSFGNENKSIDKKDNIASMSQDVITVLNNKLASKFQFKVILRKEDLDISPKLAFVAFTFLLPNYRYKPNIDKLDKYVKYDVPKLNQQAVPEIGNSICSPTSCAMLLMFQGHDFSIHPYPHEITAKLFKDYGANIYGNWVFNTVGMSSYGEAAHVARMYSIEELIAHLYHVGPLAASVKGDLGIYQTKGHLLVVTGYEIDDEGQITVFINDPNINDRFGEDKKGNPLFVSYQLPVETFLNVWVGIVYIVW